ncbi:MAG: sigma-70 family RNA polymerase sigma factor [Clostridiales bacterium]|nr:sigma-70 family RNA polymerase sigma factor [Clostridiales bacterium]
MTDKQIVSLIASGDGTAMNQVIDKYAKLMWSIASRILASNAATQDMEECVADTFIYLWENPQKFDEKRGKLKTYLCIVAKSKATDRYRRLSKLYTVPISDDVLMNAFDITSDVFSAETKHSLLAAIESLEEPSKEIIIRRYYHEQKPKEIAFVLDMPVKQVENQLYHSKRKLRATLGSKGGVNI